MKTRNLHIVLAAGGTGGHIYPAQTLSAQLAKQGCQVTLITDERGRIYKRAGGFYRVHVVSWTPTPGILGKIPSYIRLLIARQKCRQLLKIILPDLVVGFGGHPSLPTVMAAKKMKVPILLHEQNAVLGRVNRLLASAATGIATSFKSVGGLKSKYYGKVLLTGTPVRPTIIEIRSLPYRPPSPGGEMVLLCIGGSQGAEVFSKVLPEAINLLSDKERQRLRLYQQCRLEENYSLSITYRQLGVEADLSGFFDDIGERISQCHLVIARSGASTIAELAIAGRPSILIPYPSATDDHQHINAQIIAKTGGALLLPENELKPEKLAFLLRNCLSRPKILTRMAQAARANGTPHASKRLAEMVLAITEGIDVQSLKVGK